MGWITWVAAAVVPAIETTGVLQYATKWYHFTDKHMVGGEPVHTLTPVGIAVALLLLALFCVINAVGVRFITQINNVLVWWKLVVIVVVIVLFLVTAFNGANFSSHGFSPSGGQAIFTAISTSGITFSFLGFRQGIELAGESDDPKRNVPFAVIGSVIICMVIYILLQVAFIGALRKGDLAHGWSALSFTNDFGPLAAISTAIGLGWLATVLYVDAVISPGDTGIIYSAVTARLGCTLARNGNAPAAVANYVLMAVFGVTGQLKYAMDWKAGATWVLPWLGGMALISYLDDLDGGQGVIKGILPGFLVNLVWSAVIYVVAVKVRLPGERVRHIIGSLPHDEADLETAAAE